MSTTLHPTFVSDLLSSDTILSQINGPLNKRHKSQYLRLSYDRLRTIIGIQRWKQYKRTSDRSSDFFIPDGSHQIFLLDATSDKISRSTACSDNRTSDTVLACRNFKFRQSTLPIPLFVELNNLVLIPTFSLVDSYVFQKSEHQGSDNLSYCFHCRQVCTFTTDSYVEEY